MNGDASKKPFRGHEATTTPMVPRTKQGPYVAPKLATNMGADGRREDLRIISPRIGRIEEVATISPNVTPRSNARRGRPGTSSGQSTPDTTPLATPANSRPASMVTPSLQSRNLPARPSLVRSPTEGSRDISSQFFLASEGPVRRSRSPGELRPVAGFVYANGKEEALAAPDTCRRESRRTSRSSGPRAGPSETSFSRRRMSSRSPSNAGHTRPKTQGSTAAFVKSPNAGPILSPPSSAPIGSASAFSPPSLQPPSAVPRTSPPHGANESSSQLRDSPDLRILSRTVRGAATRSKSPLKKFDVGSLTSPSQPGRASTTDTYRSPQPPADRRPSHAKSQSSGSGGIIDDTNPDANKAMPALPGLASPFSPLSPTRPLVPTTGSLYSVPTSPTKMESSEVTSAIADARRERKVLDLEISNNSLLAFNRSLEKEIRKLKSEVRRHRRVTSSNHFSELPVFSKTSSEDAEDGFVDEESEDEPESDASDDASTLSEGQAAAQKARDERRLQKDFQKRKQLLDDSREMNSSIKRCLDATSTMIAEAKKALEQHAQADKEVIGMRVLHEEEVEEEFGPSRGLLSPINEANVLWSNDSPASLDGSSAPPGDAIEGA